MSAAAGQPGGATEGRPSPGQGARRGGGRGRRVARRVLIGLLCALAALAAAFVVWCETPYRATAEALAVYEQKASGQTAEGWAVFGDPSSTCGLVFYPGARVSCEAYAPLLERLSEQGVLCVLVDMPLNMAFFDTGAAETVPGQFPEVERWYLAGHSLGGAMAAEFLGSGDNAEGWAGLVLLASYSTADLSGTGLDALVVVGDRDGVVSREKLAECAGNLPEGAREETVEGGNHAGFGCYGPQSGDGEAAISPEEQQAQTVRLAAEMMGV